MSPFCSAHQPPRAGLDPVDTAAAALAVVQLAMHRPIRSETIALVLGDDHRGRSIVVVDGTDDPDAVVAVVERLADTIAVSGRDGALVVASIRPGRGLVPGDVDRWLEASDIADDAGVDLLEWFVVDGEVGAGTAWCPRDLLGEPPRWPPRC
ncbi:MAG: hypothetical protein ABW122_09275 [Ilumatobacteraceae bacterium]